MALRGLEQASPERLLSGARILELANQAHSLYVSQPAAEKAKLLRMVLSNCSIDAAKIYPTYRKPFDLMKFHISAHPAFSESYAPVVFQKPSEGFQQG